MFKVQPSIVGLCAFIAAQPPERVIKSHRTWNQCAVGDYAREVCGHEIPVQKDGDFSAVHADPLLNALYEECGTLEGGHYTAARDVPTVEVESIMDVLASLSEQETYGELVEWLKEVEVWVG